MSAIDEYLQQILDAVYGEEVRGAIHDAIWQVYEDGQAGVPMSRTINGKPLSSDITLSASDVGAVPTARTVNNKALSSNITLSASDVGAVPTTLTVNSKPLSSNVTLSASDVGAVNKAGDTMTGQLNTPGINSYASSWPGYGFALSSDPTNALVSLNYDQNANKFTFVSSSNDGTGSTEAFSLPKPTATDGNWHNYDILTTRSAISIGQGGTGSTTAADARTALGVVSKTGDTMTGDLKVRGGSWPTFGLLRSNGTALGSFYGSSNSGRVMLRGYNSDGTHYQDFQIPDTSSVNSDSSYDIITTRAYTTRTVNQSSGTAAGLVSGAGIFLITVRDSGDDSHYWCGIIFHANNSSNPVATTIAQTSGFGFSWGNTIGTCVFSGATGNYQIKAVLLSKLD